MKSIFTVKQGDFEQKCLDKKDYLLLGFFSYLIRINSIVLLSCLTNFLQKSYQNFKKCHSKSSYSTVLQYLAKQTLFTNEIWIFRLPHFFCKEFVKFKICKIQNSVKFFYTIVTNLRFSSILLSLLICGQSQRYYVIVMTCLWNTGQQEVSQTK